MLANDTDIDGGPMAIDSVTQPDRRHRRDHRRRHQSLTYEPDADYCNAGDPTDTFTYTLNGGSTATVAVTVTCADDGPAAPAITDTDPASPANDRNPEVKGTVGGGNPTQVRLYKSANCSGGARGDRHAWRSSPGRGSRSGWPRTATTNLSARAVDAAGNESACSNSIRLRKRLDGPRRSRRSRTPTPTRRPTTSTPR